MKTYNVQITPCVFERAGVDEYFEISSFSHLPEWMVKEGQLTTALMDIDADNVDAALCSVYSHIRIDMQTRLSTQFFVICYKVTFGYFYGRSYREKTFDVWISRAFRMKFLEKNRTYLTREQMISICSSERPSFDRYLNNGNYGDNSSDASRS